MAICNISDRLTSLWFLTEADFDLAQAIENYTINNLHDTDMDSVP